MGLIYTRDSDIRPQDLTLDFYLQATPINGGKAINMTGRDSYTIGVFEKNKGFGITSIDIDVKPSLQPVISIVFKDLYGNLVFNNKDDNDGFNYNILFQLPYPKFRLFVKGYLGKPISFLLQVKSVKTSFQPSDGSYEIKAEFVPNVFGFFNDIPYQFLFAVKELKNINGDASGDSNTSIIDIAKIGQEVSTKVQQASDKYGSLKSQLTLLSGGFGAVGTAFQNGTLKLDTISGDSDLIGKGFKSIKFNLLFKDSSGNPVKVESKDIEIIGQSIYLSINSPKQIDLNKITTLNSYVKTDEAKKQEALVKKILTDNLSVTEEVSQQQAYSSVDDKVIDTQSIYNVMTRLAGDCAYILGYILEAGLAGYNDNPIARQNDPDIFGNYYPLREENATKNSSSLGSQVPWENAKIEIRKVEEFVKSLYTGKQEVERVIAEATGQNDLGGATAEDTQLEKRITNVETFRYNPYAQQANNPDKIIENIIQRCGLMSCGYSGPTVGHGASDGNRDNNLADSEILNLEKTILKLRGTNKEQMNTFAKNVRDIFGTDGSLTKQFSATVASGGVTYQKYFEAIFEKMDKSTTGFLGSGPSSLACSYFTNCGIFYHNPKGLYPNGAGTLWLGKKQLIGYFPSSLAPFGTGDLSQSYDGTTSDQANPLPRDTIFFKYYSFVDPNTTPKVYDNNNTIFINIDAMATGQKKTPSELIVKYTSGATIPSGYKPIQPTDFWVPLVASESLTPTEIKSWVTNLNDSVCRKFIRKIADKIFETTNKKDEDLDNEIKQKAQQEQQAQLKVTGASVQLEEATTTQVYVRDEAEINAVYTQFHHICQAWIALANTNVDDFTGEGGLPDGTNDKVLNLRTKLEKAYRNTSDKSFFYLNFEFPLVSEADPNIDIRDAIINTDPLLENNAQTSTLNMMQNICTMNNFLLQPIPGGVTSNLEEIFTPHNDPFDYGAGRNALSIIWSPTPENRLTKNNPDIPIYPNDNTWFDKLNNITKPVLGLRYGDPNNIIVKSIKAGTDDNKVTSESLQATSDIVNNQNQNKKKSFDCSMLAVMQGRSYKISLDLIGNAQLFPTMLLAVDGLPIFTGLYWITEVVHKITPNNMETTVDAVKMKYNGNGKFAAVLPITKRTLRSFDSGGGGGGGTEGLGFGGDINYNFLQLVKDKKIKNTDDINPIIKEFTKSKYNDFPTWFNAELAGNKKPLCAAKINADNFKKVWDFLIPIVWPDYGTSGCNFLEFVALNAIMYEETGGTYESKHEGMNSVTNEPHPGIAYAYDAYTLPATNGKAARSKSSYNKAPNKTAGELFNDPSYIDAFKGLKFGTDPKVVKSNDAAWKGTTFPKSLFTNVQEAVTTSPTFISEADFYKYAGRGFIGSTWRSQYKDFVKFILTYSGSDPIVRKYQGNWKASPYNGNEEIILNKSSNADWDDLFTSGAIQGFAIYSHAKSSKYQYMAPLTKPKEELIKAIEKEAKKVNAGDDYQRVHRTRVYVVLDTLYPEGATQIAYTPTYSTASNQGTLTANKQCTEVTRGKNKILVHTGTEPQFYKRDVHSITLHYTAGWGYKGGAQKTVDHVGACGGKYIRGGIHWAVDWQGEIAQGIPETIYCIHGNSWNNHGIGIEICNLGGAVPQGDGSYKFLKKDGVPRTKAFKTGQNCYGSPFPGTVDLGFSWLGYQYYQEYTDAQIAALEKLIKEIFTRYPKIKQAIQGQNLWTFVFRAINGKPAPGSKNDTKAQVPKYGKGNAAKDGIFTHWSSTGGDHTDAAPTPKLVAMLKRLGMNEG